MRLFPVGGCSTYALFLPLVLAHREYLPSWSANFYRPHGLHEVEVKSVGLVNVETVFFATDSGISTLHDGLLTPVVELRDAELTSFHLCHHRSSIFYETLSRDGGVLTIYEYNLALKESVKVTSFQETVPAKALACIDHLLLRSSRANLVAISLATHGAPRSMLQKFKEDEYLASLAVAFPADSVQHAEIFGVVPRNRSVVKLRLNQDSVNLRLSEVEELLTAGDGTDGPIEHASVLEPLHVAWLHGKLLVVDKCSLRQVSGEPMVVKTLLGRSDLECSVNETLAPAPWASKISAARGVATESEGTAGQTALLLTGQQVIQVTQDDTCAEISRETCVKAGCGWAEGDRTSQRHCFPCKRLQSWADAQRPALDPCVLEAGTQPGPTRYDLEACGCVPPPPPTKAPKSQGAPLLILLRLVAFFGAIGAGLTYCYRGYRQRQRQQLEAEMYMPAPHVQFHTFNDSGYVRYDESEPFS